MDAVECKQKISKIERGREGAAAITIALEYHQWMLNYLHVKEQFLIIIIESCLYYCEGALYAPHRKVYFMLTGRLFITWLSFPISVASYWNEYKEAKNCLDLSVKETTKELNASRVKENYSIFEADKF